MDQFLYLLIWGLHGFMLDHRDIKGDLSNILPDKEDLGTGVINQFRLQRHPAVVAEYFIKTKSSPSVDDYCGGMESSDAVGEINNMPFRICWLVRKIDRYGTASIWIL